MSVKVEEAKQAPIIVNSFVADVDLSALQFCFVAYVAVSAGRPKVGLPSANARVAGVLQNTPAAGELAVVTQLGESFLVSNAALNGGIELTPAAATGKAGAAASGGYVGAISNEASSAAGHIIRALVVSPAQKN